MARSAKTAWPVLLLATTAAASPNDWPNIGRDPGGQRYSNLNQINAGNVDRLKPAWVFHMRPDHGTVQPDMTVDPEHVAVDKPLPASTRLASSSSTPLVVDDVLYLTTPYRRVVALAADTGKLIWAFTVPGPGQPAPRGLLVLSNGDLRERKAGPHHLRHARRSPHRAGGENRPPAAGVWQGRHSRYADARYHAGVRRIPVRSEFTSRPLS